MSEYQEPVAAPAKILTMDEIRAGLSEMAERGEGAQRAQAYRLLMSMEQGAVTLPKPLTEPEIVSRMARFMKGYGVQLSQLAFREAFPHLTGKRPLPPKVTIESLPPDIRARIKRITSLKQLYRAFPSIRGKAGLRVGFPVGRGPEIQSAWCQQAAARVYMAREQQGVDEANDVIGDGLLELHAQSKRGLPKAKDGRMSDDEAASDVLDAHVREAPPNSHGIDNFPEKKVEVDPFYEDSKDGDDQPGGGPADPV